MKTSGAFALVTLLAFFNLLVTSSKSNEIGFRVDLTHIDAGKGYSQAELFSRVVQRSQSRAKRLSSRLKGSTNIRPSEGEYILQLGIGTPPFHFEAILDTGSDLIWTQCITCMTCIPQPTPYFNPLKSRTFSPLSCTHKLCRSLTPGGGWSCAPSNCMYAYSYGDGTTTIGFMGTETFSFGAEKEVSFPKLGFGCGTYNHGHISNSSGLVGFGRGPLSLISQLGVTAFSYCFTEIPKKSPLFFGSLAKLRGPNVKTIPFVPLKSSTFYYIPMKGITVGNTLLPVPVKEFQIQKDGSGGMIIDSGTNLLQLLTPIYNAFVDALKAQVKFPVNETGPLKLCYNSKPSISKFVFHFEKVDWEIPEGNYLMKDDDTKLYCFTVSETSGVSILGNIQTQHFHVTYDLQNEVLSFEPKQCDQL